MSVGPSLRSRFQGCLVGAVVGDCIGAPFEITGVPGGPGSYKPVLKFIKKLQTVITETLEYTDDTAMARCVAESLAAHQGVLQPQDLASRFAKEYQTSPNRGYGGNVITVLKKLGEDDLQDIFEPATCQFDGGGSYGNGGAMRVASVGLCGQDEVDSVIKNAKTSALLTHSNPLGYNGAILQALAVHQALHTSHDKMQADAFAQRLLEHMKDLEDADHQEGEQQSSPRKEHMRKIKRRKLDLYCQRLESMLQFLKREPSAEEVSVVLGNCISAHNSVGSAVYSFLRCLHPVEGIPTENKFERTIIYAVCLDGDTDTIASMAGAIAGAFHGVELIPKEWMASCEGCKNAVKQADMLYDILSKKQSI